MPRHQTASIKSEQTRKIDACKLKRFNEEVGQSRHFNPDLIRAQAASEVLSCTSCNSRYD